MTLRSAEAAAYGGLFLFGVVVALLGAVLPLVSEPLGLGLDASGNLFLVLNGAILMGSLAFGLMVDRFGYRGALASGPFLISAALVLVSRAESVAALAGAVFVLGLGGSALNNATNALVADLYVDPRAKTAAMNHLGVSFGLGALLLPLLIGVFLDAWGLDTLLHAVAGLAALMGLYAASPRYPPPKQPGGLTVADVLSLLRRPLVGVLGALLFFQAAAEMLVAGYLTTFLTLETGASVRVASGVLAGFWLAMMTSRLLLGRVLLRVPALRVLPFLAAGAAATLALVGFAPGLELTAGLFIATVLLYSGIIPTVLGVAGVAVPERTGTVFGLLLSVSVVGAMVGPWVGGHAAAAFSIRVVPILGASCFAVVVLLALGAHRTERGA